MLIYLLKSEWIKIRLLRRVREEELKKLLIELKRRINNNVEI